MLISAVDRAILKGFKGIMIRKPFRQKFLIAALAASLLAGCSPKDWGAKLHMVRAEDLVTQALQLKTRKVPYEKRVEVYKQACEEFARAYERDPGVYTLMRIEEAVDTCWK